MRATSTLQATAGIALASLLLTTCGSEEDTNTEPENPNEEAAGQEADEPSPRAWFEENCPLITATVQETDDETDEATGEELGTALTQGPIRPPAGIAESNIEARYFSYDEMAGEMVPESEVSPDDLICFEQAMMDSDRTMSHETEVSGEVWDGESSFTEIRTPHHEDGIWIGMRFSAVGTENSPGGFYVDEQNAPEGQCETEWSAATDIIPTEDADEDDDSVPPMFISGAEDC